MKALRRLGLGAALMGLGCAAAGTGFRWEQVAQLEVGMSEREVTSMLGPPTAIRTGEGTATWTWAYARVSPLGADTRSVRLTFVDGRLAAVPDSAALAAVRGE